MKIAYLDTIAGIAGDMTMAAFVGAGVSLDQLSAELRKLGLEGFELAAQPRASATPSTRCISTWSSRTSRTITGT